jgi:hypothetical protein
MILKLSIVYVMLVIFYFIFFVCKYYNKIINNIRIVFSNSQINII